MITIINYSIIIFLLGFSFLPASNQKILKDISLIFSFYIFILSIFLLGETNYISFQNLYNYSLLKVFSININYFVGVDNISIFYIILTTFLIISCVFLARKIHYRVKEMYILLFLLELLLFNSFINMEIFLFYLFFEIVLIPMYLIIGIWGSQKRKIAAATQFFLYTMFGSFFLLIGIILLAYLTGTTNILYLKSYFFSHEIEKILFVLFFFSFAAKVPMFPFHLWLPKAHVEAPTIGSVLLAGILLKLGSYGFLRFSLFLFPNASWFFSPFLMIIAIISIIYSAFVTMRQCDLKRIVAYSSISHMNFLIGGLFSNSISGLGGSLLLQIAHGLSSSALFICIGILYDRYKSRNVYYYGSLITIMPFFSFMFFFFNLANLGFPGTVNFVSELLIMIGVFIHAPSLSFFFLVSIFFSALYSFVLINRSLYGEASPFINYFYDLTRREFYILLPYMLFILLLGLQPNYLLETWDHIFHAWFLYENNDNIPWYS